MSLDFYFDYSCPYAYLASLVIERAVGSEELHWKPMLLGGIFKALDVPQDLMGKLAPAKATHNLAAMQRMANLLGVPLQVPAEHPLRTVEALRITLATGVDPKVVHGFFRAYWVDNAPVSDPRVIERVVGAAGHDVAEVVARASSDAIKAELRARTDAALAAGVFGAPTFVRDGALYWGVDRLPLVIGKSFADTFGVAAAHAGAPTKPHTLDFYWDFSSPFAYLGHTQVEAVARRAGATLRWRPMLLGGLFRSIGQAEAPLETFSPAKQKHAYEDLRRWGARYDVPFHFPSKFPILTVKALRCWLALPDTERASFRERTFHAYWAEGRDISDDTVLGELLGARAPEVMAAIQTPALKQQLIQANDAAVARGVFGAPTCIVDDRELFWGQDMLPFVERALLV